MIANGLTRNALFRELNRRLKLDAARRVLWYADKQPELVYLAVCVLRLIHAETSPNLGRLGPDLLKGLVRIDCGFYHFACEWCRVYSVGENAVTHSLRNLVLEQLLAALPERCKATLHGTRKPGPLRHQCWSFRCRTGCPALTRVARAALPRQGAV